MYSLDSDVLEFRWYQYISLSSLRSCFFNFQLFDYLSGTMQKIPLWLVTTAEYRLYDYMPMLICGPSSASLLPNANELIKSDVVIQVT